MFENRKEIYLMNGKTDMRKGIDGLVAVISEQDGSNIFDDKVVFLFCGGKTC